MNLKTHCVVVEVTDIRKNSILSSAGLMLNEDYVITTSNVFLPIIGKSDYKNSIRNLDSRKLHPDFCADIISNIQVVWKDDNYKNCYQVKSANILAAFISENIQNTSRETFRDWSIDFKENSGMITTVLSLVFILKIQTSGNIPDLKRLLLQWWNEIKKEPLYQTDTLLIKGAPFGNRILLNSYTKGIVSNIIGINDCMIVGDCVTAPGSEGSPVYKITKRIPIGLVISSCCWWRSDWTGLTLIADIRCLLLEMIFDHHSHLFNGIELKNIAHHGLIATIESSLLHVYSGTNRGTAIVLDVEHGILLTNSHVIDNCSMVSLFYKGHSSKASLIYKSPDDDVMALDLAILKCDSVFLRKYNLHSIIIDKNCVDLGDEVFAAGYGLFSKDVLCSPSVSKGHVIQKESYMIKTTCCVNPGMSGGAILNKFGQLIGVIVCNVRLQDGGMVYPRFSMALPYSAIEPTIKEFLHSGDSTKLTELYSSNQNPWKMFTKIKLILWKNVIIRKRHWFLTLTEVVIPIILFGLIAYGRSQIHGLNKTPINVTYYEIGSQNFLNDQLPVGEFKLLYTPYTEFNEKIIKRIQMKFGIVNDDLKNFSTEDRLLSYYNKNSHLFIIAIVFKGTDKEKFSYELRIHDKYLRWETDQLYTSHMNLEEDGSSKYMYKGFIPLQIAIDTAFIEMSLNHSLDISFTMQQFPYPPHIEDFGIKNMFLSCLSLVTIFSFIFLCPAVLKRVAEEKLSGIKELMKMVGMKSWMLYLGWFIHALSTNVVSIVIIVFLMKVPLWGVSYPPIEYCNGFVLFTFLFLYCMASIALCLLMASLFNNPTIAMIFALLFWMFSYFAPTSLMNNKTEDYLWTSKMLLSLLPNMGLYFGYSAISVYEARELGVQWHNLFKANSDGDNDITMGNVFIMFIIDTVIFLALTIYVDNVKPGKYGIAKPLHFPIYSLKNCIKSLIVKLTNGRRNEVTSLELLEKASNDVCIEIRKLKKKFGYNVVVDDLTMDIDKNKITVMLGHNGAGKTTTMSIISGMIPSTDGSVRINGRNIKYDLDKIRQDMGLCPQHNLLFRDLTVMEHLKFFSMLKGATNRQAEQEAVNMLNELNLYDKKDDLTHKLSGGMKRKLCLGMALIGNSDILILDEPTSGMDPETRRKVWDLLLNLRKTKSILITTHFMEEADALGDKIAIMANGKLQCYDTPMKLKQKYHTGYNLSLIVNSKSCIEKLNSMLLDRCPGAKLVRENGDNVVYSLPIDKKSEYADIFDILESERGKYGVKNMGLALTTLTDVFLKARSENEESRQEGADIETHFSTTRNSHYLNGLIQKRWFFTKNKCLWHIPAVVVTGLIFLAVTLLQTRTSSYYNYGGQKLEMSLSAYGRTGVVYGGLDYPTNHLITRLKNSYKQLVENQHSEPISVLDVSNEIIDRGISNIAYYEKHMVAAAEFNVSDDNSEIIINAMYSANALHGAPMSVSLVMNAVAKSLLGDSFSITTANNPLQTVYTDVSTAELSKTQIALLWLILLPIGMLFFMSNFIIFPNFEITSSFIEIQIMAGVKPLVYWFSTFLCDFVFCVILIPLMCLCFMITLTLTEYVPIVSILLIYCAACLPFTYLFGFIKTLSGGLAAFIMIGLLCGVLPTVIVMAMQMSGIEHFIKTGDLLRHIFLSISPQFALSFMSVKFSLKFVDNYNWDNMIDEKRKRLCEVEASQRPCCISANSVECSLYKSYFKNDTFGVGEDLLETLIGFILYLYVITVITTPSFKIMVDYLKNTLPYKIKTHLKWIKDDGSRDTLLNKTSCDKFEANNLEKCYHNKKAVRNVSISLKNKRCYGLLGVNGAGKTTTFRMLTKNIRRDYGQIFVKDGENTINIDDSKYSNKIGYCPQDNAVNFALTGRELLTIMAMIRGYSMANARQIADDLLKTFDLDKYSDKPCAEYSGGNKRKLCSSIAFVSYPSVIMLDEPTNGVDPASRRSFWNVLHNIKKNQNFNTSFLLCSHSMEECEALCDEIAIMKNGAIDKRGNLLQLKNDHEKGYTVVFKLKQSTNSKGECKSVIKNENEGTSSSTDCDVVDSCKNYTEEELKKCIREKFKDEIELKDEHAGLLHYHLLDPTKTLSEIFRDVEELKSECPLIEDYTVSGASLEDIFLSVARSS